MLTCKFENGGEASLRHVTVDALVLKENQILLIKRTGKILEGGKWGLIGGFVERNETLVEAVVREVMEESGYMVSDISLLRVKDNPDRPNEDRQNISFVYTCRAEQKVAESDWEVDDQKWFDLDSIPSPQEIAFDHLEDIEFYKKHLRSHP